MTTGCTGPGPKGKPCGAPVKAGGLCSGHLTQDDRGQKLRPLRARRLGSDLVPVTVRVSPPTKEWVKGNTEAARKGLERLARNSKGE